MAKLMQRAVVLSVTACIASAVHEEPCLRETGGTCRFLGCDSSRAAECVSGKCVCTAPYTCSENGKCVQKPCLRETGGTCGYFGCDSSREAECVSGKCVCSQTGTCSENGKCIRRTTTPLPAYTADAEPTAQEGSNLATVAAIVAFPLAFLGMVGVMVRRRLWKRRAITEEQFLEGDGYGQLDEN
eukprot:TRINITY_DN607_c0_g2_i1.p1 TRINITY_DN607_c0_g2~~TRINITY_DN607_c0_g2_i1.p1  ORF type:complete len:203 (-),score=36.96 TRINITY_DN607_c0_g2_i1:182-736(-)